jgi:urea transport system substrate-binding protein
MTPTTCPPPEMLEDLLANRLTAARAEPLRRHVADCTRCQDALGQGPGPRHFPFLSPPQADDELGRLGRYRVLRLLGEGGMGYVFEAVDPVLERPVALKVLKPAPDDPDFQERFLREARTLASLSHDHTVTIFEVSPDGETPYLAMELLRGETLQDRLERDGSLPAAEALALARQAAEGLAAAHAHGVVHRDVKPANLWLETSPEGHFKAVKLIDFGIARPMSRDGSLTRANTVIGTPAYMAPEQAVGRPLDGRADLYSLGAVLSHVLTGQPPFGDPFGQPRPHDPAPEHPRIPAGVTDLVRQLLSADPDQRPASAAVLIERIRHLEDELAAGRHAPPPGPTAVPASSRRPALAGIIFGGVVIAAALLVGGLTAYTALISHQDEESEPAPGPPGGPAPGPGASPSPRAPVPPSGEPIVVGVLHSKSGTFALHEKPVLRATRLAVDEINHAGGVLGRPLRMVVADGQSEEKVFEAKARQLVEKDKAAVLFGCWSSSARKRVEAVCAARDRLLFYPAMAEGLEESPAVVYLGGLPNQTVVPLAEWAVSMKRRRKFIHVGSEYVYSHAVNAILAHDLHDLQASLVTHYVPLGEGDFSAVVRSIKQETSRKEDAARTMIFCSIDGADNLTFFKALRAAGVRPDAVPTVWFNIGESELAHFRPADILGDYSVACYFDTLDTPANKAFLARVHKRYGEEEHVSDAMQTAYFGVYLWKEAVEKARSLDTGRVRAAVRGLTVAAPEGPVRVAANLHAWRTSMVGEVRRHEDRVYFEVVFRSPKPIDPVPFPAWRTRAEWKKFLDDLFARWGGRWEKYKPSEGAR